MGHGHNCNLRSAFQVGRKPGNNLNIKMVSRFIEKKDVNFTDQLLCQIGPAALPSGEIRNLTVKLLGIKPT